ncbi:MAG: hypothetical protein ACI86H_000152 [bacterium]|jgi:hypothetical protein
MSKNFTGVWATFEYLDDMCGAIKEARKNGHEQLTTHSPCPRHEIDHALGDPQSRVPFFTLIMGLLGVTTAFMMAGWMSLDWVIPVSGKTILSIPPFAVIGFELTVLFGAYGTMAGMFLLALKDTLKTPRPTSDAYKNYNGFTRDRFGVVVPCSSSDLEKVEEIMNKFSAEEVTRED